MWTKRTEADAATEVERERNRRLKRAAIIGFFLFVMTTFFFGWNEATHKGTLLVPPAEVPRRLPISALMSVILTMGFRYQQSRKRTMMICPTCEITKYDDGERTCACGGRFEKLSEMKYSPPTKETDQNFRPGYFAL